MAIKSRFFDSVGGDRVYTSADLAEVLARVVTRDGILYGYANGLRVLPTSPESLGVRVDTGAAWIRGRYVEVYGAPEQLSVATPDGVYDRIDRVVVRLDLLSTGRAITLAVKAGTPAASPSPPSLQRDAAIWELSLAQVRVRAGATSILASDITDERGDPTACGYTGSAMLQATGSGLVAQDSAYASGVSGFTPTSVKAALDALAGVRIVEMGTNSNGWYVRWENGLQVCWNAINVGPANRSGSGTLSDMYRSAEWHPSFPAQFQTPPYVVPFAYRPGSLSGARPVGASYSEVSTSMVSALQAWSFSNNSSDVILGYLAIGRWK